MDYKSHAIDKALSQQYSIIIVLGPVYICVGGFGSSIWMGKAAVHASCGKARHYGIAYPSDSYYGIRII